MEIVIYNSLTAKKEKFIPVRAGEVSMYVCGPTVYDRVHLGNARPAVVFDVLVRLFNAKGYRVKYVRNITDIDDKIINAAEKNGEAIKTLTKRTIAQYHEDMESLGVNRPDIEPLATDHVHDMIYMINQLIEKGYAYEAEGHVLFSVDSKDDYGILSKRSVDEMIAGARVEIAPYKRNPADFVLWKPALSDDEIGWISPWGKGRPGWHIECSAMIQRHLGESFDIHGGGRDLLFPHHENELAQSTACCANNNTSDSFAKYWVHNGMLTVDGQKMSKSLGNFLTVSDALKKYKGEVLRYFLLSSHYRQALDLNDSIIHQAESALNKFYKIIAEEKGDDFCITSNNNGFLDSQCDEKFIASLSDDLNTPSAISRLHELAKTREVDLLVASASILGILQQSPRQWFGYDRSSIDESEIELMISERNVAKQLKQYEKADKIRDDLLKMGIELKDTPDGTVWNFRN